MDEQTMLMRGHPHGTSEAKRVAISAAIGAAIEVYDFIGFGTAAALYLGAAFFPETNPAAGTLLAFATLGVGFVFRPIGGIVAGHLGDKFGRKPIFVASLLMMGIGTVALGLLPTYEQAGLLAPILLVTIRIIQGLAFGAEWGGAVLMTYEHAPLDKKGTFTGLMHAGFGAGLLLANLVYLATAPLENTWSWRIPFLSSIILIIVGILVRRHLGESPVTERSKEAGHSSNSPLKDVFVQHWRLVVRAIVIRLAEPAGYAIAVTFMLSYIENNGFASTTVTLTAICIAAAGAVIITPLWGRLSDRIGRKPLFAGACIVGLVTALPLFLLVQTGSTFLIILAFFIAYPIVSNALVAAQGTILPEMFDARIRFSGCSLAYQLSAAVAGLTPFAASALYIAFGWMGPALLLAALCAASLIAILGLPDSWGPATREYARELMARTPIDSDPHSPQLKQETSLT